MWILKLISKKMVIIIGVTIIFFIALVIGCTTSARNPFEDKSFIFVGTNPQGYKEYRHEQTGMVFVLIPGGTFKMRSNESVYEKPVHEITVSDFLISKYEVTQGIWQKIMNNNPAGFKKGDDYPVEQVSWEDCNVFCKKTGLRLPIEVEWEYAMRAGTNTRFYWGNKNDEDYMWYGVNSGGSTHPVGQKKPNGYGLYDMIGNVWEWCADLYDSNYNPQEQTRSRALRGGGWGITCAYRPAIRIGYPSSYYGLCFGFRCAASIKPLSVTPKHQ